MSRTRVRASVVALAAVALLTACGGSGGTRPSPSAPATLEASVPAFQTFSGMTVPSAAKEVTLRVVQDPSGAAAYRVDFVLPSAQVDACCTDGQLQTPLDVYTVPPSVADRFDVDAGGTDPRGVQVAEGVLPDRVTLPRSVLATGTDTTTALVRTYAYAQPR